VTMRRTRPGGTTLLRLLALLAVLGLVAAACGGDDDTLDESAEDPATEGAQEFPVEEGDPVEGGDLIFGVEADTQNPWTPAKAICAISCHQIMKSVYDPLMLPDEDGIAQPNLLESIEPNEDYTVWTLTPRQGITFHDGTPFDGEAIRANLQDHKDSSLTQVALKNIERVEASPDRATAIVTMTESWSAFPIHLTSQLGYMASPTWLADTKTGAAPETEPVGTGPFVFESYQAGVSYRGTRNEDYWKQGPGGAQLPYLDSIEYRIYPEGEARVNAVQSGESNIAHTSSGDQIARIRDLVDDGDIETIESDEFGELGYSMLNVNDQGEHANPALQDVDVRRALAHAIDRQAIQDTVSAGVGLLGNGPFPPGTIGYLEDTGFPEYDPDEARRLVEEYESENGPIELEFSTTNDPINLRTNERVVAYWNEVGVDAEINQIEQGQYILEAVFGRFNAFAWRNHGGFDPDQQNAWWHSDSYQPEGGLALNFGRFRDEVIDENLEIIRASGDADERREAAEAVNRRFGEQVYNIWGSWTIWSFPHQAAVNGIDDAYLSDGETKVAFPSQDKITAEVAQIWCEGGNCG
jgi:peptide/nickel transport system substrate-binding protein